LSFGENVDFDLEYTSNFKAIFACDEVGRGPLAGPVVGCAVFVSNLKNIELALLILQELGITDSKKISAKKRKLYLEKLGLKVEALKAHIVYELVVAGINIHFCIGENSPEQIDEVNILNASLDAMGKSVEFILDGFSKLKNKKTICLIDGNKQLKTASLNLISQETVVKGDSKSLLIGLASIIAKEYRDLLMDHLDKKYPGYGLAQHAGYPTKQHREAIKELGITAIHRKTFGGVREYVK
jgi:ribonuclease HII